MNNVSEEDLLDNSAVPKVFTSFLSSSSTKQRTPSWLKTNEKSVTQKNRPPSLPPCKPNQTLLNKKQQQPQTMSSYRSTTNHSSTALECILFDSRGYVTYSALGSFFIPMLVMIFFYWRIYKVASETTRALNRGYISGKPIQTTAGSGGMSGGTTGSGSSHSGNGDREVKLTLRVHRGYWAKEEPGDSAGQKRLSARSMLVTTGGRGSATSGGSTAAQLLHTPDHSSAAHNKSLKCVRRVVDFCRMVGDKQTITRTQSEQKIEMRPMRNPRLSGEDQMPSMGGSAGGDVGKALVPCSTSNGTYQQQTKPMPTVIRSSPEHSRDETEDENQNDSSNLTKTKKVNNGSAESTKLGGKTPRQSTRSVATSNSLAGSRKCSTPSNGSAVTLTITPAQTAGPKSPSKLPLGSWSRGRGAGAGGTGRVQAKRFRAETKAAKTVGIIVGGFIFCWFPFFTVYLTRGLCDNKNCIPDQLLTVFAWFG